MRLENKEALLLIRGTYPAKIHKLFYKDHPSAGEIPKSDSKVITLSKPNESNNLEDELMAEIEKGMQNQSQTTQTQTQNTEFNEPIAPIPDEDFQP